MARKVVFLISIIFLVVTSLKASLAENEVLNGDSLASSLRRGGYILYFRHAATDWSQHDRVEKAGDWWSCNQNEMRQLSESGHKISRRIGAAIRNLAIPIGTIYASEYCRARDTAKQFRLGKVIASPEIMNMRAAAFLGGQERVIERARKALKTKPPPGTNIIWVAHGNIVRAATGEYPGEAGCIIFKLRSDGTLQVVSRLDAEDWITLAQQH